MAVFGARGFLGFVGLDVLESGCVVVWVAFSVFLVAVVRLRSRDTDAIAAAVTATVAVAPTLSVLRFQPRLFTGISWAAVAATFVA